MPAAIAIPLALGLGTATAGIVGAKLNSGATESAATTTSDAATKAAQIQTDAANHAADLQAQSDKDALDYTKSQSALSLQQYNAQQQRLQPYRNLGNFAMGLPNDPAPAPLTMPNVPGTTNSPSPSTTQSGASASQDPVQSYMLGLLGQGVSPQSVADQTNAKFGSSIGTGAKYYADTNTIGLPGFYLAGPQAGQTGGWTVNSRNGGSSAAPAASSASTLTPLSQATMAGAPTLINPTSATGGGIPSVTGQPYRTLAEIGSY